MSKQAMVSRQGWGARVILAACLVSVLGVIAPRPAHAAASITVGAAIGYHGVVSPGWNPLLIQITNNGGDFSGSVAASTLAQNGPPSLYGLGGCNSGNFYPAGSKSTCASALNYVMPISLAAQTTKTLSIEMVPDGSPLQVEVKDDAGAQVATTTVPAATSGSGNNRVVAVITDTSATANVLKSLLVSSATPLGIKLRIDDVAWLAPSDVPRSAQGLSGFDGIVVANATTTGLDSDQQVALVDYVHGGGTMLILGGSHAQTIDAGMPPELIPVSVSGSTPSALSSVTPARGTPLVGKTTVTTMASTAGTVTMVNGASPLVVSASVGSGTVIYSAIDFAAAPLASWSVTPDLMSRALSGSQWNGLVLTGLDASLASQLGQVADSTPDVSLPSPALVQILFAIYVFAVGPLVWVMLRRRRRPDMAWIAVPVISLLVTAIAYQTGWGSPVQAVMGETINVIQVDPGTSRAAVTSVTAVFLPHGGTHLLRTTAPMYVDGVSLSADQPGATVILGSTDVVHIDNARPASVNGFVGQRSADIGGGVMLSGNASGPNISNGLASDISNVIFVRSNAYQSMATIGRGQTAGLPNGAGSALNGFALDGCGFTSCGNGHIPFDDQRRQAVDQVAGTLSDGGTYLVGLADASLLDNQVTTSDGSLRTINVVVVPILRGTGVKAGTSTGGNTLTLPPNTVPSTTNVLGSISGGPPTDTMDLKPGQAVTEQFQLQPGIGQTVTLYVTADPAAINPTPFTPSATMSTSVAIEYFEPTANVWTPVVDVTALDGQEHQAAIPAAAIASDSTLKIRYTNLTTSTSITLSYVSLDVTPSP